MFNASWLGGVVETFASFHSHRRRVKAGKPKTTRCPSKAPAALAEALERRIVLSSGYVLDNLWSFTSSTTSRPQANVTFDPSGDMFGTASFNGVYEIAAGSTSITTLNAFSLTNGDDPVAGVTLDTNGNLFGTTTGGGTGDGVIWEIAAGSTTIIPLATFNSSPGFEPVGGVTLVSGNLYGTTQQDSAGGYGTIWELAAGSTTITTLASFNGANGMAPDATLTAYDGNLWGTTSSGGDNNDGAVFSIPIGGTSITTVASFNGADGSTPMGSVSFDTSGDLFGTTNDGGPSGSDGTIWEIAAGTTSITTLASLNSTTGDHPEYSGVSLDPNGDLFGTAANGAANSKGSVWELPSGSTSVSVLLSFNGADGQNPEAGVSVDSYGDLFGTTEHGGANSDGAVFELAVPTQLGFVQQPANAVAGTNIDGTTGIQVAVEDPSGGPVISDTDTVTLTLNGGMFSNGDTSVTANAVNGVATFSGLQIDTAGSSYQLQATDGTFTAVNSNQFAISPGTATQLAFVTQPVNSTTGTLPSVSVAVEDTFGNVVTSDSSTVTLTLNTGTFYTGSTASVAASSGVATFNNLIIGVLNTYSLSANDGTLTGATSSSFTISVGPGTQVAFLQQPTNTTAGDSMSPDVGVVVEDAFGNVVTTDYSSTIALTLSSNIFANDGSPTITATAYSGAAGFSPIVDTAGTYTITASDGSLTAATSNTFTISPNTATQLAFVQQPTNTVTGDIGTVQVAVEDTYGNVVTSDSSTVWLTLNGGSFWGGATTASASASGGIATFNSLEIGTPGAYSLYATDGSLAPQTSSGFTISVGPETQLAFAEEPVSGSTGTLAQVQVAAEDAFGNLTTSGDLMTVTLSSGTFWASMNSASTGSSSGIATFSSLVIGTPGTYTLTATDNSNTAVTSVVSTSFTISPGSPYQLAFTQQPANATAGAGQLAAVDVAVQDSFGNVCNVSDYVQLTLSSGVFSGGSSTISTYASSGIASFSSLVVDTAGTMTLTAADTASMGVTTATSNSFTISPSTPTSLAFVEEPVSAASGNATDVQVAIQDTYGNDITSDNSSTIKLTLSGGTFDSGGTTTTATVSGGVASFSLPIDAVGTYQLAASDQSSGTVSGTTSSSFTITPGPLAQMVFATEPTDYTAGSATSAVIYLEDAFGNVETGDSGDTVSLTPASGGSPIASGTVSNGTVDLSIGDPIAGSYTLNASDSVYTSLSATANSYFVDPGNASQLVFTQQPTNTTAGTSISPTVQVAAEDPYGNITTSNAPATITLYLSSGTYADNSTYEQASTSGGVANFSSLTINTAGSYTLSAYGTWSTTSSGFTVSPAAASQLVFTSAPSNGTVGSLGNIYIDVEDSYGNVVTSNNDNITLNLSGGSFSTGSNYSTSYASSGVDLFEYLSIDTPGAYQLSASDGSLSGTSNSFTLVPGSGTQLVFTQQPSNGTAGDALGTVTVGLYDSFGNLATGDTSTVTISSSAGSNFTAVASGGYATFNSIVYDTAGNFTMSASDPSVSGVISSGFTISPNSPAQLAFEEAPSGTSAGSSIGTVGVAVEDAYGNVVYNSDQITITLSSNTFSDDNSSETTTISWGTATFSGLTIDTTGTYTITASDGSETLPTIMTSSFTITPSSPSQLVFTQQPTNATLGTAISPTVVVDVEDAYGNLCTSDTSGVVLDLTYSYNSSTNYLASASAVGGVATFTGLTVNSLGTYTLSATDSSYYWIPATNSSAFTVSGLMSFTNGDVPESSIVFDSNGDMFGTTTAGGTGDGSVFEIAAGSTSITTLACFDYSTTGSMPMAGLTIDSSGDLFGTTTESASGDGTIFEIASGSNSITVLANFNSSTGTTPMGVLTLDSSGDLFGTASAGGSGHGTVFELVYGASTITTIAAFNGNNGSAPDGGVTLDSSGDLFGTTESGSSTSSNGTVFEIAAGSTSITTIASFNGTNGKNPYSSITLDSSGDLFGTTRTGTGTHANGTVFEILAGSTSITTLATFNNVNGSHPLAGVIMDSSGDLFGTTNDGGADGSGTVFELVSGASTISTLASFDGTTAANPDAGLVFDTNGNLFGTTTGGGIDGCGTVFELVP